MITKKTIFAAAAAAVMALPATGALAAQNAQNPNATYSQENPAATDSRNTNGASIGTSAGTNSGLRGSVDGNIQGSANNGTANNNTVTGTARGSLNTTVDDKTMASFAEIHPEVERVNREYAEKIRKETNVEKRNELAAEANKEIENVIGDSDISMQEYNRLSLLIQQDANLQKQYHRALNK